MTLLFSCGEKRKNNTKNEEISQPEAQSKVEYNFKFPDTLIVGKKYKGFIEYKSIVDSLTTERYIYYLYNLSNELSDIEVLKKKKLDTFVGVTNNKILVYNVVFEKTGVYYIDGIIQDEYFLPSKKNDEVILRKDESRATHKLVVIDSLKMITKKIVNPPVSSRL